MRRCNFIDSSLGKLTTIFVSTIWGSVFFNQNLSMYTNANSVATVIFLTNTSNNMNVRKKQRKNSNTSGRYR